MVMAKIEIYLLVLKLDQIPIVLHNLIPLTNALVKQLRQRKPLPRHLIPIVRIHELVIIHTIRRIALHALDSRLTAVQRDDIVDEGLAGGVQRQGFGRVGLVVFGGGSLADFEVFAGGGGVGGEV